MRRLAISYSVAALTRSNHLERRLPGKVLAVERERQVGTARDNKKIGRMVFPLRRRRTISPSAAPRHALPACNRPFPQANPAIPGPD